MGAGGMLEPSVFVESVSRCKSLQFLALQQKKKNNGTRIESACAAAYR